jgi:hypothetical protein
MKNNTCQKPTLQYKPKITYIVYRNTIQKVIMESGLNLNHWINATFHSLTLLLHMNIGKYSYLKKLSFADSFNYHS